MNLVAKQRIVVAISWHHEDIREGPVTLEATRWRGKSRKWFDPIRELPSAEDSFDDLSVQTAGDENRPRLECLGRKEKTFAAGEKSGEPTHVHGTDAIPSG